MGINVERFLRKPGKQSPLVDNNTVQVLAEAKAWFRHWRHQLRHGQYLKVLQALTLLIQSNWVSGNFKAPEKGR